MAKTPESLVRDYRYKPKIESSARDINTYVKPQERYVAPPQGTTALESLSRALRENSPILMKMFREKQDKRNEELLAQGERLQKESDIKDWNEYVKKHPEHEKYSPFLREGFEKQAAMAKGADYQLWLQDKLTNDATLASMTDQTQINEYIDKQTAEYVKANKGTLSDRAIASYFIPSANNSRQALMSQFADRKLDELMKAKYDSYEENVTKNADAFIAGNTQAIESSEESATALAGQLAAQISAHAGNTIIDVSNPKKVNDSTMNAVLTWYNSLAPEYSEFGKKVIENLTGKDNQKLIGITRYKMAFDKVTKEKYNDTIQKEKDEYWRENRDKALKSDQALLKYGSKIADNPSGNHAQTIAQAFHEFGPDAASTLQGWAQSCLSYASSSFHLSKAMSGGGGGSGSGGVSDNALAKFNFLMSLDGGRKPSPQELQNAVSNGILTPLQAYKLAQNEGVSKEMSGIAEETMLSCYNTFGINSKNLSDNATLAVRYNLRNKFGTEAIRFNNEFQDKNGRVPTTAEIQTHFLDFSNKLITEQEKINTRQNTIRTIQKDAEKGKATKLTPEAFELMIDDYNKNGVKSALVQLKANSSVKYRRMPMSQFVNTLAESNGIKLNNPAPAPTTAPSSTAPNKDKKKRGHKM
jgi:hypothetical protein